MIKNKCCGIPNVTLSGADKTFCVLWKWRAVEKNSSTFLLEIRDSWRLITGDGPNDNNVNVFLGENCLFWLCTQKYFVTKKKLAVTQINHPLGRPRLSETPRTCQSFSAARKSPQIRRPNFLTARHVLQTSLCSAISQRTTRYDPSWASKEKLLSDVDVDRCRCWDLKTSLDTRNVLIIKFFRSLGWLRNHVGHLHFTDKCRKSSRLQRVRCKQASADEEQKVRKKLPEITFPFELSCLALPMLQPAYLG